MQFLSRLRLPQGGQSDGLSARVMNAAPTAVSVLVVVALAAQLAVLLWRILAPAGPAGEFATAVVSLPSGPNVPGIVNAHLFGTAAVAASGDAASAPATNMRLVLAGTLAGSDPAKGWAIIGETAQAARVYATGATVPGGATLREVYADRAILERGGRLESLPLPRLAGGAPVPVVYSPGAQQAQPNLADTVRNLVQQDPGAVSEIIRPQPVFAGGQQKGYRVYPGRNRQQFASLGLMPGDLVTAVNGTPLDDPNRGLEILRGVGAGGPVTLTVERNGAQQQVTVDASAAAGAAAAAPTPDSQPQADEE
jgi:general secretion pathway protein C